jgi:hypothetical protein
MVKFASDVNLNVKDNVAGGYPGKYSEDRG